MQINDDCLFIFAEITPKPEHLGDCREAIDKITPVTLNEEGCHVFGLLKGQDDDPRLFLFEVWQNAQALREHHDQTYVKEVFEFYQTWLAEPVKITKMSAGSTLTMRQFEL